ncbi:MAG: DUF2059 domain-containing protein [Pseudomonadota bacterium]
MKKLLAVVGIMLVYASVFAETKPSDASLDELLTITDSQKLIDGMWPQMDAMLKTSEKQALGEVTLNEEQQKISDKTQEKMATLFKEEFAYDKMKPMIIKIYKESFSQEEIDGMVTFYKSKAGKAVIKKMPTVMQSTMANVQAQMSQIIPKLQKIQQESIDEIKAKSASTTAK